MGAVMCDRCYRSPQTVVACQGRFAQNDATRFCSTFKEIARSPDDIVAYTPAKPRSKFRVPPSTIAKTPGFDNDNLEEIIR